jgi:2-polyprenyl-6-methoxyphenol hydroxylase-like FAD-dependent oxidoreductase
MRVLIVGAGIAGLVLAGKLRQQGCEPVVIERIPSYTDAGYGIGLWPLGSCVLHGLGVYSEFIARGLESRRYELADHFGEVLQSLDLSVLTDSTGPMIMLSRTDLIEVLLKACGDLSIRFGTTAEGIVQAADIVRVSFSDSTKGEFDLVVACDGIHSQIRSQIFREPEIFDSGWMLWTWWGRDGLIPSDVIREYWGRGFFFGAYPVPRRCMFVAGLPADTAKDPNGPADTVRATLATAMGELVARVEEVRLAIEDAHVLFAWPMTDVRAHKWYSGRVVLCGDAGTAFLPTAGVGASNAMRSAAALADELSKAGAAHVPWALEMYVKRCQRIVEKNQDDSRKTARLMFVESKTLGWGRDQLIKHCPAKRLVKQIVKSMRQPF